MSMDHDTGLPWSCEEESSGDPLLVLRLQIGGGSGIELYPDVNWIGTGLLTELLRCRLQGLEGDLVLGIGPLNRSMFTFMTSAPDKAVEVIKGVLEPLGLLEYAEVYLLSESERGFRSVFPRQDKFWSFEDFRLEGDRLRAELMRMPGMYEAWYSRRGTGT